MRRKLYIKGVEMKECERRFVRRRCEAYAGEWQALKVGLVNIYKLAFHASVALGM